MIPSGGPPARAPKSLGASGTVATLPRPIPPALGGSRLTDDPIQRIQEFIWNKYVEGSHTAEMDERDALRTLEEFHRTKPASVAPETYYLGILYFELAYEQPDEDARNLFLARAATILERYIERTGDAFEDIGDRLDDAKSALSDLPEGVRRRLFKRVAMELDASATAAEKAQEAVGPPQPLVVDGMVQVPAGPFASGPAKAQKELKGYWIDVFPVTNAEYRRFVESTGYRSPKFWTEGRLREPEAPVVGISWYDAFKYAAFAGKSLPTKDQWEKAARGRGGRVYPWGDEFDPERAVFGKEDGSDGVAPVGQFPANVSEWGVRDMVGNVWQWTESPDPNDSELRVICGGSWVDPPAFLRCDEFIAAYPKDKYDNIGFRCVRLAKE